MDSVARNLCQDVKLLLATKGGSDELELIRDHHAGDANSSCIAHGFVTETCAGQRIQISSCGTALFARAKLGKHGLSDMCIDNDLQKNERLA
mmetsp:Transcript_76182/g.247183  ORF Transcript_76182/g.247183 Transcript_76182/m.247183 type:complete len:92 (+) Transcript_76182:55-330(+)